MPVAYCQCPVLIMNHVTHNDRDVYTGMSCLVGHVDTSYHSLLNTFGEPKDGGPDGKTDAVWEVQFSEGTVASIYNWKNGHNYCGLDGVPVHRIKHWNVGGYGVRALELVELAIKTQTNKER